MAEWVTALSKEKLLFCQTANAPLYIYLCMFVCLCTAGTNRWFNLIDASSYCGHHSFIHTCIYASCKFISPNPVQQCMKTLTLIHFSLLCNFFVSLHLQSCEKEIPAILLPKELTQYNLPRNDQFPKVRLCNVGQKMQALHLQPSVSILNVNVYDSKIWKRLNRLVWKCYQRKPLPSSRFAKLHMNKVFKSQNRGHLPDR